MGEHEHQAEAEHGGDDQAGEGHAQIAQGAVLLPVVARLRPSAAAERKTKSPPRAARRRRADIGRAGAQPEGEPRGAERHRHVGDAGDAQQGGMLAPATTGMIPQQRTEHHLAT